MPTYQGESNATTDESIALKVIYIQFIAFFLFFLCSFPFGFCILFEHLVFLPSFFFNKYLLLEFLVEKNDARWRIKRFLISKISKKRDSNGKWPKRSCKDRAFKVGRCITLFLLPYFCLGVKIGHYYLFSFHYTILILQMHLKLLPQHNPSPVLTTKY